MSATILRDGSIDFSGVSSTMQKVNELLAHSTQQLVVMNAREAERMEARMRIWQLRESCGVKQTLRILLSDGAA